jgi:ABC-type sulfate transport system permease component
LDKFVLITNNLQSALQACESREQIVDTLHNFQRNLAVQISDLQKALTAAQVNFVLGTLGALLTYQHGEIIKGVVDPIMLQLPEFVGGIAVLNCMTKAHELIKPIDSPVAYLLHAQQEFA